MADLKPALTYEEQIRHLIEFHNLSISDESAAMDILKKVSYYRLSAYGIGLRKKDAPEEYADGTTLDEIFRLYTFDSSFRAIVIHVIEQLEIRFRSQIANFLALKYGAEGYTDPANFQGKRTGTGLDIHANILESFKKECERQRNAPFVKHHEEKYGGHYPIWVATELFTFGNLTSLFSIMLPQDRKQIADLYHTEPTYLNSWLLSLVEVRNICAHYGRLYNMPLKQSPHLYTEHIKYRLSKLNKVFPVILVIKQMLPDSPEWYRFETRLEQLFDEYRDVIRLSFIGFPPEWKSVLRCPTTSFRKYVSVH